MTTLEEKLHSVCVPVRRCPVCDSAASTLHTEHKRNRYSEEIARLLAVSEDELLRAISCVRCDCCELGYKNWWFKPEFYYRVFVEAAPTHPHGWDAVPGRFSPVRFLEAVDHWKLAVDRGDLGLANRWRRTVLSFLENVEISRDNHAGRAAVESTRHLDHKDLDADTVRTLRDVIAPLMVRAKPFGRFAGFGTERLEEYVRSAVPTLRAYGEVGCPLWGLFLRLRSDPTIERVFLRDEERAFWGPTCSSEEGTLCSSYAQTALGITQATTLTELSGRSARLDVVAVINYLDHLADPMAFLKKARSVTSTILIVTNLDRPDLQGYIQHNTALTMKTFDHIATRLGMGLLSPMDRLQYPDDQMLTVIFQG